MMVIGVRRPSGRLGRSRFGGLRWQLRSPLHAFDSEQLWTVVSGRLSITVDGEAVGLGAGDTLVLPTGVER
jgi:mannose-6-phosphate isomerase-like protein (cupin superfamily)